MLSRNTLSGNQYEQETYRTHSNYIQHNCTFTGNNTHWHLKNVWHLSFSIWNDHNRLLNTFLYISNAINCTIISMNNTFFVLMFTQFYCVHHLKTRPLILCVLKNFHMQKLVRIFKDWPFLHCIYVCEIRTLPWHKNL